MSHLWHNNVGNEVGYFQQKNTATSCPDDLTRSRPKQPTKNRHRINGLVRSTVFRHSTLYDDRFFHSFEYYIIPHPFSCLIELDSRLLVETL